MLIKEADSKSHSIAELERLLAGASGDRQKALERELAIMRAGVKGERDAAYLIDFDYRESQFTVVLHDLRLEINGRVAQIDHLLLNRSLECFVLETKHFHAGIKITEDGEFMRWNAYKKTYEGMASPLAQNERHIAVMRDAFAEIDMPTRLGLRLKPSFASYILISPEARIDRPEKFDTSHVIKADMLKATLSKHFDKMGVLDTLGSAARTISTETLKDIAQKLLALHRPSTYDVAARFGGSPATPAPSASPLPVAAPQASKAATPAHKPAPSGLLAREDDRAPRCNACSGAKLAINFGKSYYFKCADCDANTPARVNCGQPQHKERLRKEGRNFFRECADCGTSVLYFINPT